MSRHAVRVALALAFSLYATACGPPWRVMRVSGPPSALSGMQSLGVTFDYSALIMGGMPEAQWLLTQPPEDQSSYLATRSLMETELLAALGSELAPMPVVRATGTESHMIVVRYTMLEMGAYRVVFAMDSRLDSTLAFGPSGTITDEIAVRTARVANLYNPSIDGRMSWCARRVAQLAAEYIRRAQ